MSFGPFLFLSETIGAIYHMVLGSVGIMVAKNSSLKL